MQKELVSPHQLPKLIQKLKLKIKTNNANGYFSHLNIITQDFINSYYKIAKFVRQSLFSFTQPDYSEISMKIGILVRLNYQVGFRDDGFKTAGYIAE